MMVRRLRISLNNLAQLNLIRILERTIMMRKIMYTGIEISGLAICVCFLFLIFNGTINENMNSHKFQDEYFTAAGAINDVKFNNFLKNENVLSDGTHIKIESSTTYPEERIVYYKDIALSIKNNNGLAKVVTAFSKNGKEISMPESGTVFTNINTVRSVLTIILILLVIFKVIISS